MESAGQAAGHQRPHQNGAIIDKGTEYEGAPATVWAISDRVVEEQARLRRWLSTLGATSSADRRDERAAGSRGAARHEHDTVECAPAGAEAGHRGDKKTTPNTARAEKLARKWVFQLHREQLKVQGKCQQAREEYENLKQEGDQQVRAQLAEVVESAKHGSLIWQPW